MKCVSIFKLIKYIVALNKNSVFLYLFNKNNYNNYYSFFNYFISTVKIHCELIVELVLLSR